MDKCHVFLGIAVEEQGDTGWNINPGDYLLHIDTGAFKLSMQRNPFLSRASLRFES
jgi:hypothetical protein